MPKLAFLLAIPIFVLFILRETWHGDSNIFSSASVPPPWLDARLSWLKSTTSSLTSTYFKSEHPQETGDNSTKIFGQYQDCKHLPGANRVLLILKTGATEIADKLPIHMTTTFTCVPHYMIVSDFEQTVATGGAHGERIEVQDVIGSRTRDGAVTQWARDTFPENFGAYDQIRELHAQNQNLGRYVETSQAWTLDKWKFMPMVHRAWEEAAMIDAAAGEGGEKIDWLVMMEADTSLSWTNLLMWLGSMNASEPIYAGSVAFLGPLPFAHGGSGVVMSRAAVARLEEKRMNGTEGGKEYYDMEWEAKANETCCGDALLADAFLEVGVNVTRSQPIVQGETPLTFHYNQGWCTPAVTFHHVSAAEVDTLWNFQREWAREHQWGTPYLYRDLFHRFIESNLVENKPNWDNLSKGTRLQRSASDELDEWDRAAVNNMDACATACQRRGNDCVQWKWKPGYCWMDSNIRFGKKDDGRDIGLDVGDRMIEDVQTSEDRKYTWTSGWMSGRVEYFTRTRADCGIKWDGRRNKTSTPFDP